MKPDPHYYRILSRLKKAAERESAFLLRSLPEQLREQVNGISIRFEDRPTQTMVEQGIQSEALSTTVKDGHEITVFLMPLFDRYGKRPGAFGQELRRVLLKEIGEACGLDLVGDDT